MCCCCFVCMGSCSCSFAPHALRGLLGISVLSCHLEPILHTQSHSPVPPVLDDCHDCGFVMSCVAVPPAIRSHEGTAQSSCWCLTWDHVHSLTSVNMSGTNEAFPCCVDGQGGLSLCLLEETVLFTRETWCSERKGQAWQGFTSQLG